MSRFIPEHPKKGSPAAKAWAKRMLLARMKKASIRTAGRLTEKAFFGPKGVFAKAGHTEHLEKNPETRSGFSSWPVLVDYLGNEGWKPLGEKGVVAFSRTVGSLFQVLQKEAREWRVLYRTFLTSGASPALSLGTYQTVDRAMIAANRQANEWIKKNPGAAWHEGMEQTARRYGKATREPIEKAMFKGIEVAHKDSAGAARRLHMNKRRTVPSRRRRVKHNPLAVFGLGNPPKRINAGIAGVVYSRCLEIRAEKTKFKPGLYRHPFARSSGVQILALDNGDLLVHSTRGVNLWEPVP